MNGLTRQIVFTTLFSLSPALLSFASLSRSAIADGAPSPPAAVLATSATKWRPRYLSETSWIQPDLLKCYRWVSKWERDHWKTGDIYFLGAPLKDVLGREGDRSKVTYCWSNPVTARIGGRNEVYGDYLLRIDLVSDRVLYDRNEGIYYIGNNGVGVTPESAQDSDATPWKRGVSSEVVYSNYCGYSQSQCMPWFQEYLLRSKSVVLSFTLGDADLKKEFYFELDQLKAGLTSFEAFHFFFNFFDTQAPFPEWSGRPYLLQKLEESITLLEEEWKDPMSETIYLNPEARMPHVNNGRL